VELTSHDWVLVILGGAVGVPAGMISIFFATISGKLGENHGKHSKARQLDALKDRLEKAKPYYENPNKLQEYLIARLLYITLLWIGQEAIDGVVGAVTNIQYGVGSSAIASLTAAGQGLLAAILLTVVLLIGTRAYRLFRDVRDYDSLQEVKSRLDGIVNGSNVQEAAA
jgi:hypothetical protein